MVVIAPNPWRVLVSREIAADDRQGFCLVLALTVSASVATSTDNFTACFNYVLNYVFSENYVFSKTLNNYVFNYVLIK